jgi:cyclic beta-1,2-glucan synthetase
VFKYRSARYEILVDNPLGVSRGVTYAELDGTTLPSDPQIRIRLVDDGNTHRVRLVLGTPTSSREAATSVVEISN